MDGFDDKSIKTITIFTSILKVMVDRLKDFAHINDYLRNLALFFGSKYHEKIKIYCMIRKLNLKTL